MANKFCMFCGTPMAEDALFCARCGKRQTIESAPAHSVAPAEPVAAPAEPVAAPAATVVAAPAKSQKEKQPMKGFISNLIKKSLLLTLALILTITAFLPVVQYKVDSMEGATVGVSAAEYIGFFFNSLVSLDSDEVQEELEDELEDLYDRMEDLDEDEYEDAGKYSELGGNAKSVYQAMFKYTIKAGLMNEDTSTTVPMFIAAVAGLCYILLAIALLVVSAFAFVGVFVKAFAGKKLEGAAYSLMALSLGVIISAFVAGTYAFAGCFGTASMTTQAMLLDPTMAAPAIVAIVFIAIFSIAILVLGIIMDGRKLEIGTTVKRGISLTVCIIIICLSFAPLLTSSVKTTFSNGKKSTANIGISADDFLELNPSEDEADALDDFAELVDDSNMKKGDIQEYIENYVYAGFSAYTAKEVNAGDYGAVSVNYSVISYVLAADDSHGVAGLFVLIPILNILVALALAFVIWQNMRYIITGEYGRGMATAFRTVAMCLAAVAVLLAIIFIAVMAGHEAYLPSGYGISISAGLIFYLIFAVGNMFVPQGKKGNKVEDNSPCVEAQA